ncbi:MAG: hypothetical protein AAF631_07860 [Pseudomonadota bacterium]
MIMCKPIDRWVTAAGLALMLAFSGPAQAILISNSQGKSAADDELETEISRMTTEALSQVTLATVSIEIEANYGSALESLIAAQDFLLKVDELIAAATDQASTDPLGVNPVAFDLPPLAITEGDVGQSGAAVGLALNVALRTGGEAVSDRDLFARLRQRNAQAIEALNLARAGAEAQDASSVRIALLQLEAYRYFTIAFSTVWEQVPD